MEIKKLKGHQLVIGNTYSILGANLFATKKERFDIIEGELVENDQNSHILRFKLKDGSESRATLTRYQYEQGSNIVVH